MRHLDDLKLGEPFACGRFRLTQAEIVDFAGRFDPQPFHLDEAAAAGSHFGRLCASGLHTQAAAIGLMVRAIADVAVVAGYALHSARFFEPVWPEVDYDVTAMWVAVSPSPANPARGRAEIAIEVTRASVAAASLGVTYVVARRVAAAAPGQKR